MVSFLSMSGSRALRTVVCLSAALAVGAGAQAQTRRIAVMSFDVGADAKNHAMTQFGIRDDLGRALSDVFIDRLVQDGKFTVIERAKLDKVLKEQNFSNSDRADPSTAAKIGKIAGVDAIIIGSVTEFGLDKKENKSGLLTQKIGILRGTQIDRKTSTVTVATTARVIDVNTATVLASATGNGMSTKTETGTAGGSGSAYAGVSQKAPDFSNPMVAEATNMAIVSMSTQLEQQVGAMPAAVAPRQPYKGVIADVSGTTVILTVGTASGVHVGDTVEISRPLRTVKNPQTGAVLKVINQHLATAKVTEADANSATATLDAPAAIKVNDQVTSSSAP